MTAVTKRDAAKPVRLGWSVNELALALGVNANTIYRMIQAGELNSFPVGGEHRVTVFDVARLIGVPAAELDQLHADVAARDPLTRMAEIRADLDRLDRFRRELEDVFARFDEARRTGALWALLANLDTRAKTNGRRGAAS